MAEDQEKVQRIFKWTDDQIIGMRMHASMIAYKGMAIKSTHLVALYPDGELVWAFLDPALNAANALQEAKRVIMTTGFSEEWVQQHQEHIDEFYPELSSRERLLFALAARLAATYYLPLMTVIFGVTLELNEPTAMLHTHASLRIDRALMLLREKIQESGT